MVAPAGAAVRQSWAWQGPAWLGAKSCRGQDGIPNWWHSYPFSDDKIILDSEIYLISNNCHQRVAVQLQGWAEKSLHLQLIASFNCMTCVLFDPKSEIRTHWH
jgi:hypothetical protein